MKTILLTRPRESSKILAVQLQKKGFKAIISPLFEVEHLKNIVLQKPQAILITSMNSIPALLESGVSKDTKILAVGTQTKNKIKGYGYNNTASASGSASRLKELALDKLSPRSGPCIHLSGEIVTIDLAQELSREGFQAQKMVAYKIIESKSLSTNVINKIKSRSIDTTLVYSQNTASIFHKLLTKHNLLEYCQSIRLLCLSDKISNYCLELGFEQVGNIKEIID